MLSLDLGPEPSQNKTCFRYNLLGLWYCVPSNKKNILLLPDMMENICNPRAQKTSLSTASAIKQGLAPKQGLQYLEGARLVARMWGGGRKKTEGWGAGTWEAGLLL